MGKKHKTGKERLDKYYQLAKDQGYRARSAFKLIQLAKKTDFLSKSRVVIDLCAAPGGWSQVAQRNMPSGSKIIAIDLAPIKPIHGVTCIQSDITSARCRSILKNELKGERADAVLHDGAPNVGSSWVKDAYGQNELTLHATKLACEYLRPGGVFVTKVFRSADYNSLLWVFGQLFGKVESTKPTASRNVSAEIFVLCTGFKDAKIDPRFFDPKWVFMETVDPSTDQGGLVTGREKDSKGPSAALKDHLKYATKRHRSGYEFGDDLKIISAHDFVAAKMPAEVLVTHHRINLEAPDAAQISASPLTTPEIHELCGDLQVLGKRDLSVLLKWRMKLLREREKGERTAQKEATKAELTATVSKVRTGAPAAVAAAKEAIAQDVDDAIAEFLEEGREGAVQDADPGGSGESSDDDAAEAEVEREIEEQVEKRRREERIEKKKLSERQKKQEWKKRISLGLKNKVQNETELFKNTERNLNALEDEDDHVDPRTLDSGEEDSEDEEKSESDSDEGLDRAARLEVDLAVDHELRKMRASGKFRAQEQRQHRKKKETRRQRVMAAWAGELSCFNEEIDRKAYEEHLMREVGDEDNDDDDDGSDGDLAYLRNAQRSVAPLKDGAGGADGIALEALAAGPAQRDNEDVAGDIDEEDKEGPRASRTDNALVPMSEASEEALRVQHRASRWFSQDIFRNVGTVSSNSSAAMIPLDRDSEDEDGSDRDDIKEVDESELPKLPLTDKEKRRLKRKKETETLERLGKKPKKEDMRPMEVAPMEPPRPLVSTGPWKPTDPRELAETMAVGSLLVDSKKARMDIIDAGYNRWSFDGDEGLPDWFTEEENKYNKPELPVTKELMNQFRAKLREINARPIRKVAEARARKHRRLKHRLEKIRETAMSLDSADMSDLGKARQMRRLVAKAARQDHRTVSVVAIKKGGGANQMLKGKVPKGAKVKVVDRRMKSDVRAQKRADKRNGARAKARKVKYARKVSRKRSNGAGFGGRKSSGGKR